MLTYHPVTCSLAFHFLVTGVEDALGSLELLVVVKELLDCLRIVLGDVLVPGGAAVVPVLSLRDTTGLGLVTVGAHFVRCVGCEDEGSVGYLRLAAVHDLVEDFADLRLRGQEERPLVSLALLPGSRPLRGDPALRVPALCGTRLAVAFVLAVVGVVGSHGSLFYCLKPCDLKYFLVLILSQLYIVAFHLQEGVHYQVLVEAVVAVD